MVRKNQNLCEEKLRIILYKPQAADFPQSVFNSHWV